MNSFLFFSLKVNEKIAMFYKHHEETTPRRLTLIYYTYNDLKSSKIIKPSKETCNRYLRGYNHGDLIDSVLVKYLNFIEKGQTIMDKQIRIMPCLDMQNGRVVKGVHFVDIRDAGDPVECAKAYCKAGADELALLDITATVENRPTMLEVVKKVAEAATVPFTVGGGISDVASAAAVLEAGADKISTSSAAFRKPEIIKQMVDEFGPEKVTVAIDVDINESLPSGYEVYIDGGRTATGADAIEWARKADGFGVPVILPTSKAGDGAKTGYDLPVIRAMADACSAEIVASGGAGTLEHFYEAVEAGASILLAASVFHFHIIDIPELKEYLRSRGLNVK